MNKRIRGNRLINCYLSYYIIIFSDVRKSTHRHVYCSNHYPPPDGLVGHSHCTLVLAWILDSWMAVDLDTAPRRLNISHTVKVQHEICLLEIWTVNIVFFIFNKK